MDGPEAIVYLTTLLIPSCLMQHSTESTTSWLYSTAAIPEEPRFARLLVVTSPRPTAQYTPQNPAERLYKWASLNCHGDELDNKMKGVAFNGELLDIYCLFWNVDV